MFVDNELEGAESVNVASHLRDCAQCSREIANVVRLKRATHQAGQRFTPPAAFQRKMMAKVSGAKSRSWWSRALVPVSAVALIVIVAGSLMFWSGQRNAAMGRELADVHVATMASVNPVDVVSSDMHTVKPWFTGKVPFTFNIPELKGSDYELIGGRVAYVAQSQAAQLVFKHGNHHCSVFIVPEKAGLGTNVRAPMNFTTISWRENGLVYVMVTDASPATMRDLENRLRQANENS
jgi:anti-sigma factor RsiW